MSTAEAGKKDLKLVYNELFSYRHWWSGLGMNVLLEKSFVLKQAKKKGRGGPGEGYLDKVVTRT